ncbi:MAG: hypothetical protein E6J80_06215 [Deltaproteobacteria bacterium]|nr:MAG: hypothetical protein E6J80_06215 [Deltaproteobacteria bacterium]
MGLRGTQALEPPGAIVEPDNDLGRLQEPPPEQVGVPIAIQVLSEERPVFAGFAAERQHRKLTRAAQLQLDAILQVPHPQRRLVNQAVAIEI